MKKVSQLKQKPNKPLIEGLERLLQEARTGRLRSFVCVTQADDGELCQTSCVDHNANIYTLTGCVQAMLVRMASGCISMMEPAEYIEEE